MGIQEIMVRFGGDLSGLSTALRGVKGMMDKAASAIKESFRDAFRNLFAPISVAGAVGAVHALMEDVKNIKRISESTGLDTGVTQDILNLGKASGVASDAIESMLDKFVKGLAPGSDPEEALYAIADKMSKIEDPSERARLAVENFGKSGAKLIPILMQGSEGVKKLAEEWGKLDEAQIAQMEHANQTLEKTVSKSKVLLAEWLEGLAAFHKKSKEMKWWQTVLVVPVIKAASQDTTPDQPDVVSSKPLPTPDQQSKAKVDAGVNAARKIAEEEEYLFAKPHEKVLMLTRQILAIRREIEDTNDPEEQVKLGEKMVDLEGKRKSIQEQLSRTAEQRAKNEKKNAEDILKTQTELAKLGRERERDQMSEYMPSLQELAGSGYSFFQGNRWQYQQGPFAGMAQRVLNLQNDAKESLIWNNKDRFKQDVSQIEELKKSLREAGVMSPDDKLTSIDENIGKAKDHLKDLSEKASGAGLIVRGTDDDE